MLEYQWSSLNNIKTPQRLSSATTALRSGFAWDSPDPVPCPQARVSRVVVSRWTVSQDGCHAPESHSQEVESVGSVCASQCDIRCAKWLLITLLIFFLRTYRWDAVVAAPWLLIPSSLFTSVAESWRVCVPRMETYPPQPLCILNLFSILIFTATVYS